MKVEVASKLWGAVDQCPAALQTGRELAKLVSPWGKSGVPAYEARTALTGYLARYLPRDQATPESLSSPRGLELFGSVPSTLDPWPATYVSGARVRRTP